LTRVGILGSEEAFSLLDGVDLGAVIRSNGARAGPVLDLRALHLRVFTLLAFGSDRALLLTQGSLLEQVLQVGVADQLLDVGQRERVEHVRVVVRRLVEDGLVLRGLSGLDGEASLLEVLLLEQGLVVSAHLFRLLYHLLELVLLFTPLLSRRRALPLEVLAGLLQLTNLTCA